MDHPETQSTLYTRQRAIKNGPSRDTDYIVHKTTGNQEWTIQRHRVHCTQDNGQSRMDHPFPGDDHSIFIVMASSWEQRWLCWVADVTAIFPEIHCFG
jgi:hypothetical protein